MIELDSKVIQIDSSDDILVIDHINSYSVVFKCFLVIFFNYIFFNPSYFFSLEQNQIININIFFVSDLI